MTELHLDRDEWQNILDCVKDRRDSEQEHAYREYLTGIATKIEIAFWRDGQISDGFPRQDRRG